MLGFEVMPLLLVLLKLLVVSRNSNGVLRAERGGGNWSPVHIQAIPSPSRPLSCNVQ